LLTYEKAVGLDPNNADIYLHRGQLYVLLDQMESTIKNFEISAGLRPDFVSTAAQLAYTKFNYGKRFNDKKKEDEAIEQFEQCLKKFPDSGEVYFLYAQVMADQRNIDLAEKYFKKFMELEPTDAMGLVQLGVVYLQSGQMERGVQQMMKAIELDPKCHFACEALGTFLIQTERVDEAIKYLEKGIQLAQTEGEVAHMITLKLSQEIQTLALQRLSE